MQKGRQTMETQNRSLSPRINHLVVCFLHTVNFYYTVLYLSNEKKPKKCNLYKKCIGFCMFLTKTYKFFSAFPQKNQYDFQTQDPKKPRVQIFYDKVGC